MMQNDKVIILADPGAERTCAGELYIQFLSKISLNPTINFHKKAHQNCVFTIVSGSLALELENTEVELFAGDVFVVWKGTMVRGTVSMGTTQIFWFNLLGDRSEALINRTGLTKDHPYKSCRGMIPVLDRNFHAVQQNMDSDYFPIRLAWEMLDTLQASSRKHGKAKGIGEACKEMIESDFMSHLSIENIAQQLRVDRATLFRQFKSKYHVSPQQYLLETKLNHAKNLLLDPSCSVKMASMNSGFKNAESFSRRFRARHGMGPKEWRELEQKRRDS